MHDDLILKTETPLIITAPPITLVGSFSIKKRACPELNNRAYLYICPSTFLTVICIEPCIPRLDRDVYG